MIDEQYLVVKEFGLFSTIFRRVDGQEIIVPNSLLSSTKLVHNMRRSTSMYVIANLSQRVRDSLLAGGRVQPSRYPITPRWKSSNSSNNESRLTSSQTTANGRTVLSISTRWSIKMPSISLYLLNASVPSCKCVMQCTHFALCRSFELARLGSALGAQK